MSSDYQLEDTLYLPFTTRAFATGIPTALVSGAVDIYEDVTAAPIITGETLTVSLNSVAGFNMITVTATDATGFGAGQSYTAILQAGTVGGVSVVGEVVAHFTLDMSAAAKDLANGTDGLGAIKAETANILTDTAEIGAAGAGLTAIDLPNQTMDITGNLSGSVGSVTGAVGSVTGAVGSVTATVTIDAGSVDAIWDETLTAHVTADSAAVALKDVLTDTGTTIPGTITTLQSDTDDIQTRLPAALVGGAMDSDVSAMQAGVVTAAAIATDAIDADALAADAVDEIWDEAMVETTGAPAVTGSFRLAMQWMFALSRNKITQTSTTTTLRNDADGADLATSPVSDDATTYTRGEWST